MGSAFKTVKELCSKFGTVRTVQQGGFWLAVVYGGVNRRITSQICHLLRAELKKLLLTQELDAVLFNHLAMDS